MIDTATWRMDPDHIDGAVNLLRRYMDDEGASILLGVGGAWLPLLEVDAEQARTDEWVEAVDSICIEGGCSTTLPSLAGVEPGPVRVLLDEGVDGPVLYVGQRAVLAIAGANITRLPEGLLHIEAAEASLEQKVAEVRRKLQRREAAIDFDPATQSLTLVPVRPSRA